MFGRELGGSPPWDNRQVIDAVGSVRESVERGYTLPAGWYSDPAVYRLEQERIFRRTWQYAGHVSKVAEPGDYFTCLAGEVPVVVVRDHDGAINAFVNVCRHRGTQVASGCGHRETLQCPYHAWTYGLDGSLRAAPRSEREPGFDKSDWGLFPVKTDTWGPFVFVNPDVHAAPLADFLGDLPATVEASGLDLWSLRSHGRRYDYVIAANWKIVVENYLECYHCPVAHPSFSDLIDVDPDAYRLEAYEWYSSQIDPVRQRALGGNGVPYDPAGEITLSQFHFVWPNFTLNILPGPPNMAPLVFLPLDEERTAAVAESFFAEGVDEALVEEIRAFGNEVGREDQDLVESVHRGLKSGMVPQGRLLLTSEHLIQHFQRLVCGALTDA